MLNAVNQELGTVEKTGGNLAKLDLFQPAILPDLIPEAVEGLKKTGALDN